MSRRDNAHGGWRKTPEFAKAQRQRKKVEALFAELKNQIGLRRLRPFSGVTNLILRSAPKNDPHHTMQQTSRWMARRDLLPCSNRQQMPHLCQRSRARVHPGKAPSGNSPPISLSPWVQAGWTGWTPIPSLLVSRRHRAPLHNRPSCFELCSRVSTRPALTPPPLAESRGMLPVERLEMESHRVGWWPWWIPSKGRAGAIRSWGGWTSVGATPTWELVRSTR